MSETVQDGVAFSVFWGMDSTKCAKIHLTKICHCIHLFLPYKAWFVCMAIPMNLLCRQFYFLIIVLMLRIH